MSDQPTITLNQDVSIPQLGFGTWKVTGDDGREAIKTALDVGYRHIDTAYHYGNHEIVGEAISNASVARDDVFVTTKIWRDHLEIDDLHDQFEESLQQLDMEYVDLLLVHWPNESVDLNETLSAMQELKDEEKVRAIGVSNFTTDLLEEALDTDVEVVNNQVEFHPTLNQKRLKQFCDENDIVITAYSPLAQGRDLQLDLIQQIGQKHDRSPAQVILNWLMQKGMVAIPRSKKEEHIKSNFQSLEWELDDEDLAAIDDIGRYKRIINPEYADFQTE